MTEQAILKQLNQLPENRKMEVLDFIGYLVFKEKTVEKPVVKAVEKRPVFSLKTR